MAGVDEKQVLRIFNTFAIDAEADGYLGKEAYIPSFFLLTAAREMGYYPTKTQVDHVLQRIPSAQYGEIIFAVFLQVCETLFSVCRPSAKTLVDHLQTEKPGVMTINELRAMLKSSSDDITQGEVLAIEKMLDPAGSGVIPLTTLVEALTTPPSLCSKSSVDNGRTCSALAAGGNTSSSSCARNERSTLSSATNRTGPKSSSTPLPSTTSHRRINPTNSPHSSSSISVSVGGGVGGGSSSSKRFRGGTTNGSCSSPPPAASPQQPIGGGGGGGDSPVLTQNFSHSAAERNANDASKNKARAAAENNTPATPPQAAAVSTLPVPIPCEDAMTPVGGGESSAKKERKEGGADDKGDASGVVSVSREPTMPRVDTPTMNATRPMNSNQKQKQNGCCTAM